MTGPLFSGGQGPHGLRPSGSPRSPGAATLPDLLGVYAGSVLSAARLQARQLGGRRAVLGSGEPRGRSAIRRGDTGKPHGANVELKIIDPSGNPYLAAVSFLGSALRGIDKSSSCRPR